MAPTTETCPICRQPLPPASGSDPATSVAGKRSKGGAFPVGPPPHSLLRAPPGAPSASEFRPFCSSRCRLLDLSKWLSEDYAIPGPPVGDGGVDALPPDDDEGDA